MYRPAGIAIAPRVSRYGKPKGLLLLSFGSRSTVLSVARKRRIGGIGLRSSSSLVMRVNSWAEAKVEGLGRRRPGAIYLKRGVRMVVRKERPKQEDGTEAESRMEWERRGVEGGGGSADGGIRDSTAATRRSKAVALWVSWCWL